ncbi:MAG: efflux RND transporter periplasmic adaptor subunit [Chitinophagales bacterium]|nr:efflux RND transporter periplasmic adaptor subunit [Chitinophagales bacterium]
MKKFLLLAGCVIWLVSCQQANTQDPQARLAELKKQQLQISGEITTLQAQIAANDTSGSRQKPKLVAIETLQPGVFQHFLEVQGKVDADENVGVTPQIGGVITNIFVQAGNRVRKGQVLAITDAATLQANIEVTKNSLTLANTLYEKQKSLWDQQIGTEVQYLTAKNQKEAIDKNLNVLQQQMEMTKIKSPIDGTVDEVMAKLGEMATPGRPSFRVVNLSKLKVIADVAERYAGIIKVGDQVTITLKDAGKQITKKITAVSQVIDPNSRSFQIEARLGTEEKELFRPNMIVIAKIGDYSKNNSIAIPINTVQNSEEGKFVFIASNQDGKTVAIKQIITPGMSYGDRIEIVSGLKAGDQLITVGYQDLNNGQLIALDNLATAANTMKQ